ncbi:MAG: C40 family peptidase [Acidimicrobiia bacterium]
MPAPVAAAAAFAKKKALAKLVKVGVSLSVGGLFALLAFFGAVSESANAACQGYWASPPPAYRLPGDGTASADPDPVTLEKFMWAKREVESGNNYQATIKPRPGVKTATASGAYQYIDSTWTAPAHKEIWSKYGDYPRAYLAPPAVQDEVARFDFVNAWRTYGNWFQVAMVHYMPAWVPDPNKWDIVPAPEYGNTLTLRQYAEKVLKVAGIESDAPAETDLRSVMCRGASQYPYAGDGTAGSVAVAAATKYIGVGYKYAGGQVPGSQWRGMDCSGFMHAAYRDIGIKIGTWSGSQINDGINIGTDLNYAKPGDLIVTGTPPKDTKHVQMYVGKIDGKHVTIESAGAGDKCTGDAPLYGAIKGCAGIAPPSPYHDTRAILGIRRIVCSVDANGNPVPCGATSTAL